MKIYKVKLKPTERKLEIVKAEGAGMTFEEWEGYLPKEKEPIEYNYLEAMHTDWKAEREKLIGALELFIEFMPDKFPVPVGYQQIEAQARAILAEVKEQG